MRFLPIVLILHLFFASCKDREVQSDSPDPQKISKESADIEKVPFPDEKIFNIEDIGVTSMDGVLPLAISLTADCGSHRWIYKLSKDGKAEWALLLILWERGRFGMGDRPKPYLESYESGWRLRRLLTEEETFAKLALIKEIISAEGHLDRYEFFYDGGVQEPEERFDDPDDPFARPEDGRTQREQEADLAKMVNDSALMGIAEWVYYFEQGL